ncbi:MAG: 3-oxoacyl-ACP synthase [Bacteroidia bacterium]|nr:3-oxoacyl-ACP synthase [Bacteroidia bacterium]
MNQEIKKELYHYCLQYIHLKQQTIESAQLLAKESANNDSKSSAGDKHETSRAMAQLEQEKLGIQFQELEKSKQILAKITPDIINKQIGVGALVKTSAGNYYLSISAGKCEIKNEFYYFVSALSPIGKALMNASSQKQFVFNNQTIEILSVT